MADGGGNGGTTATVLTFPVLSAAMRELERYYGCSDEFGSLDAAQSAPFHAAGYRAQRYDAAGHGVFDSVMPHTDADGVDHLGDFDPESPSAATALHQAMLDPKHRAAVQTHTKIEHTLATLTAAERIVLSTAFTPRRWSELWTLPDLDEDKRDEKWRDSVERRKSAPRGIPRPERQLRILLSMRRSDGRAAAERMGDEQVPAACLVALALEAGVAAASYQARYGKHVAGDAPPPSHGDLLRWMMSMAEATLQPDTVKNRHSRALGKEVLTEIRIAAGAIVMPALAAYDAARRAREDAAKDLREYEANAQADAWQQKHDAKAREQSRRRLVHVLGEEGLRAIADGVLALDEA